jgi:hypothetical protein
MAVLLYPVDVLWSSVLALHALFSDAHDVAGGPLGAVAGIALPGVTLVGPIYPRVWVYQELHLSADEFDALIAAVEAGEGVAAFEPLIWRTGERSDDTCITAVTLLSLQRRD